MVLPKRRKQAGNLALIRVLAIRIVAALVIVNFAMDAMDMFSVEVGDDQAADERILLSAEDMFDAGGNVSSIDSAPGDRLTNKEKESLLTTLHKEEKERKRRINMLQMEKPSEVEETFEVIDVSSWAKPSSTYAVDTRDLWENEDLNLPRWMIDYFRWNKEFIVGGDWETTSLTLPVGHKFLYVTCLKEYNKCGGTADRLSSLPFFVKVAASTHRHILFQWTKPAALEEFLRPPVSGFDWRVPATKEEALLAAGFKAGTQDTILDAGDEPVLQVKFQSHDHGSTYYNARRESEDEPNFKAVFHSVWKIFFTPSPALALEIEKTMAVIGLVPGGYSSAHVRALYDSQGKPEHLISVWAKNAVNCAHYLQYRGENPLPVYFASDSALAVTQAEIYGRAFGIPVLSYNSSSTGNPLHLDKAENWQAKHPADFYDVFVDLYMMSMGIGVAHGLGGYGMFASLMSSNATSIVRHMSASNPFACPKLPRKLRKRRGMKKYHFRKEELNDDDDEHLFASPMADLHLDAAVHHKQRLIFHTKKHVDDNSHHGEFPNFAESISTTLWDSSSRMPQWMKDYFVWHRQHRELVHSTNYLKYKFLVITCFRDTSSCGDLPDRLRPMPFYVLLAAETNRILLISWEKPAPLEDFLMPPRGGVDWRTPSYMVDSLREKGETAVSLKQLRKLALGTERIVKIVGSGHDSGSQYYNTHALSSGDVVSDPFRHEYRDCWYALFTPVREIVRLVEYEMDTLDLYPEDFIATHLGANYTMDDVGRDKRLVANWTRNALNCASNLRPAGPYLFVSDFELAKLVAIQYGQHKEATVVARMNGHSYQNLRFDGDDWTTKRASDYYPAFVDLYMMSMASCFTYNVGVLAQWANLISGKSLGCSVRHWTPGVNKNTANRNGCPWTGLPNKVQKSHKRGRKASDMFILPMAQVAES